MKAQKKRYSKFRLRKGDIVLTVGGCYMYTNPSPFEVAIRAKVFELKPRKAKAAKVFVQLSHE